MPLYTYVDQTYLRGIPTRGRRHRIPPRFSPLIWNQYATTLSGMARTTNAVEAWHGKFSKLIVTYHSNVWKFLEYIKKEQHDIESLITQLLGGHQRIRYPIRDADKKNHQYIETIVRRYFEYKERNEIPLYLEAISYRLKRPNVDDDDVDAD